MATDALADLIVSTFATVALLFGGIAIAWVVPPLLMQLLGINFTWYRIANVPKEDLFVSNDPLPPPIFTQLQQLGFEPCGLLWVTYWFTGPLFVWPLRTVVFYSPEHHCFASVFRFTIAEEPRVTLQTGFTDGAMVQTFNYGMSLKKEHSELISQCIVTGDLCEQLSKHREALGRLGAERQRMLYRGLETLVTMEKFWNRRLRSPNRRVALYLLCRYLLAFVVGFVILIVVDWSTARAFDEPFQIHSATLAIASLAMAGLLIKIRQDLAQEFVALVAAQRRHEVVQAVHASAISESASSGGD